MREKAKGVTTNMLSFLIGLQTRISSVLHREEGQALVEYGLILFLISVVCILALTTLGSDIKGILEKIGTAL
jgi:pilus assembly protein Flp/PilA